MRKVTASEVIQALVSDAEFGVYGDSYDGIVWAEDYTGYKPTKEEFESKKLELENEYDEREYQRKRAPEYPDIKDQLDAIWKGGDAYEEMLAKVMAVKDKYPKPGA